MRTIVYGSLLALFALVAGRAAAHAQADTLRVTLAEAQRLALEQNPAFLADAQVREIAGGQLRQARAYAYNPEFEIEAPNTISNGVKSYDAWLWQEVEWAGQRGLRIGAAEGGLTVAESFVADAARRTLADVSVAFYAAVAAARRAEVAEDLLALNTRLLGGVRIQVAEGEISRMDANFADIEAGRARALVLSTRREATTASLELGRLIGETPEVEVRANGTDGGLAAASQFDADSLVQLALSRRPDLAARTAEERQSETLTRLAKRAAIPNLRLGAVLSRDPVTGTTSWGFGVGLPLPFWSRNQGLVAANSAATRQASLARSATELLVRTEVEQAVRSYTSAEEEARIFATDVLEPARQNQALLETAYRSGRIGLTDLVLLRNQLVEVELGYWDVWLTHRATWVDLQSAIGSLRDPRSNAETP